MSTIKFNKSIIRKVVRVCQYSDGVIWLMKQQLDSKITFIYNILNYMQNVNGEFMKNNTSEYKVEMLHKVLNNDNTLRETVENYNLKVTPSIVIPE